MQTLTAPIIGDLYGCGELKHPMFTLHSDEVEINDLRGIALMNMIYKNLLYLNSTDSML